MNVLAHKIVRPLRRVVLGILLIGATILPACGFTIATTYPNSILNADGEPINFDDVLDIVNDGDLSDDEKRQALEDLGIEDQELIDALLGL